jgi:hypothetical protein
MDIHQGVAEKGPVGVSKDSQRIREIFIEVLQVPRNEQGAVLDELCGTDESLRTEVESLLDHHDDAPLVEPGDGLQGIFEPAKTARSTASRYRELGEIGAGGFGVVVQRFDRSLRRVVASKSPMVSGEAHDSALLREARLLAYLDHPGVVQVFDLSEGESEVSYTMELLEGTCLTQQLADLRNANRLMPVSEALRIVSRVSETVANAHAKGLLHLDIKPSNVMLQSFGHVSLLDWGMARFFDLNPYQEYLRRAGEIENADVHSGEVVGGTPAYMPPEQFDPKFELSPTADIYALGTLLFELLTGVTPFEVCDDDWEALRSKKMLGAPGVRERRPELSERLAAVCAAMLAPSPQDRPASVSAILEDLAALSDVGSGTELLPLASGEVLFEQGADGTTAYQVLSGELEILVDGETIAKRKAGDIIGELAMLSRAKRSATVRASSPTTVRAIDWATVEDELSKVDPLIGRLLRKLSDKLIETTRG